MNFSPKAQVPFVLFTLLVLSALAPVSAQIEFRVDELTGIAKVQRSGKQDWEDIRRGRTISSNDIVETFFKTRIVLELGRRVVVIAGSNSKILCEFVEKKDSTGGYAEISINLLSGGVFVKTMERDRVRVFTSTGAAHFGKGALSAVVESKSGETGFQVLEGQVETGNIAQHQKRPLTAGQTTMIFPGKEATPPLYITHRHVTVLKHFFGDEYIESQLSSAGITPTDEKALSTPLKGAPPAFAAENRAKPPADQGVYKRTFSMEKIYGAILTDEERENRPFVPIARPGKATPGRMEIAGGGGSALTSEGSFPAIQLRPSFALPIFSLGLRLSIIARDENLGVHQFGGPVSGYLDLVDHLRFAVRSASGLRALRVSAGALENFTLGEGLVVRGFENRDPYSLFQPLGVDAVASLDYWTLSGFLSDAALFDVAGVHVAWEPNLYHFGGGYYYDSGRRASPTDSSRARFFARESAAFPESTGRPVHMYELGLGVDLVSDAYRSIQVNVGFAQVLLPDTGGFVLRVPGVRARMKGMDFGAAMVIEQGRMLFPQIHSTYTTSRYRPDSTGRSFAYQSDFLPGTRSAAGFDAFYRVRLFRTLAVEANYSQQFVSFFYKTVIDSSDTGNIHVTLSNQHYPRDFNYRLALTVGDSLVPMIQFVHLFVSQEHGGLLPFKSPVVVPTWGFAAGAQIITRPLIAGLALEGRFRLQYLDLTGADGNSGFDDIIDKEKDRVAEFYAGIRWGFL